MKHFSVMALLATAALCGCTDEATTPENPNFPQDGVMRFATSVNDVQTRSGYDSDNITTRDLSLWVTPTVSPKADYTRKSIILHHTTDGGWGTYSYLSDVGSYTPTTLLWQDKTTPVEVVASNFGGSSLGEYDLQTGAYISVTSVQYWDSHMTNSDFLYFRGIVNPTLTTDEKASDGSITTYALSNGKVRLPLRHINSKLNITLTLGTEFNASADGLGMGTDNPLTDVKVNNVYCDRQFNMVTGTFGEFKDYEDKEVTPGSITLTSGNSSSLGTWDKAATATDKAVATYECILIPQEATFSVSFTLGGKAYKWTSANAVTFDSGKAYTLALTVGKDAAIVSGISAKAWETGTPGNNGNLETE